MMVNTNGSLYGLMSWQKKNITFYLWAGIVAWVAHEFYPDVGKMVPPLPLAIVGGALGIFVAFRTNSAYDRWWEGRKLWGRMINSSRHWGTQALTYAQGDVAEALVNRHIAYVHTLRCLLRKQDPFADNEVNAWLTDEEKRVLPGQTNITHALLFRQMSDLKALAGEDRLNEFRLQSLDSTLMDFLNIQGGCERIKKTPLPPGYGFIAEILVRVVAVLFPFAVIDQMGFFAIPTTVVVALAFMLISEAGRVLEDPFTMFWNGLPLYAMSKTIEHNLRDRLGHTDLPPLPTTDSNGVLM
jgi:putative membrane protein